MPASYSVYSKLNLVHVRYVGQVTTEQSVDNFIAYLLSGDAKPGHRVFADFSECTDLAIGFDDMVTMIAEKLGLLDPYDSPMQTALYAPDPTQYALCAAYERLVATSDKQVAAAFQTKAEALAFLGLDQAELPNALQGV